MSKSPKEKKSLTIVTLEAENIKRLKAVRITPDGALVQITGRNAQGKTSVLDAIWWALEGLGKVQAKPIREGCQEARIKLDLGEIVITRTFRDKGDKITHGLTVQAADGSKFDQPQTLIDSMLGALTLDPLAFLRAKTDAQFDMVKALVPGVDFAAIAAADKRDRERRTLVGQELRRLKGAADAIKLPDVVPAARVDDEALADELEKAITQNAETETRRERRETLAADAKRMRERIQELANEMAQLGASAGEIENRLATAEPLPDLIDVETLRARHYELRQANEFFDRARDRQRYLDDAEDQQEMYDALTAGIEKREADKQAAIAAAKMPVEGLGFGDGEILLNGQPFAQASDAEQLRASVALAMAGNPEIKIIRIRDGSLLDAEARKWLAALAAERGFQVWMERVAEGKPIGFVIEDGEVKAKGANDG
jgi:DNA repair exonuclease SbcCD ATPase subunit